MSINTEIPVEKIIVNDVEVPIVEKTGSDMLQARVDATNSCDYLFYKYSGSTLDFIENLDTSNANSMISVFEECNRRYKLFLDLGVSDIYEYNQIKEKRLPYQVLFIEEVVLLLQDKKNVGMKHLKLISSICRACGIFIICTCQRPRLHPPERRYFSDSRHGD